MIVALESLTSCFQGLIPSTLFTCSNDGIPNAAYLSHVEYVDPAHVALSFQFFNKSRRNIAENPHAFVRVLDPDARQGWCLRLRYVRSETTGPVFERMALRIEAIASYCGLKGIFKLLAADIYEVLPIEAADEEGGVPAAALTQVLRRTGAADPIFTMKALQDLSARIHSADSLERLIDSILAGLEESFGFSHSMILVPTEEEGVLVTIATRGYAENGAGAEARHGEGIIGLVAEARKPIRISGLLREMLYAYAVHKRAQEQGLCPPERPHTAPGPATAGEPAWRAAPGAGRARRRALHRKRGALSLSRAGQGLDRTSAATSRSRSRTCSSRNGAPRLSRSRRRQLPTPNSQLARETRDATWSTMRRTSASSWTVST